MIDWLAQGMQTQLLPGSFLGLAATGTNRKVAFGTGGFTYAASVVAVQTITGLGFTPISLAFSVLNGGIDGLRPISYDSLALGSFRAVGTTFSGGAVTGSVTFSWIAIG